MSVPKRSNNFYDDELTELSKIDKVRYFLVKIFLFCGYFNRILQWQCNLKFSHNE